MKTSKNAWRAVACVIATTLIGSCSLVYDYSDYTRATSATSGGSGTSTGGGTGGAGCTDDGGTDAGLGAVDWVLAFGSTPGDAGGPEKDSGIGPGTDFEMGLAVDPLGTAYFTGTFAGAFTIGAASLTPPAQQYSLIMASISAAGDPLWATKIGDGPLKDGLYLPFASGLALDKLKTGKLIVEGSYHGALSLDQSYTNSGYADVFLGSLSSAGQVVDWGQTFGDPNSQLGANVAVANDGSIAITGFFNFTLDLKGKCAPLTTGSQDFDLFVAKLDSSGVCQWVRKIGAAQSGQFGTGVAFDSSDRIALVGSYQGSVDFGNATTLLDPGPTKSSAFVALLKGTDGTTVYASSLGESNPNGGVSVAADASGNVVVAASLEEGMLGHQAHVWKIDSQGLGVWNKSFGGATDDGAASIDVDDLGRVLLTGYFSGKAAFGSFNLTSEGATDAFVAVLGSSGDPIAVRPIGGTGSKSGSVIRHIPGGHGALVLGGFSGTMKLGCTSYTAQGDRDVFLARFSD